MYTPRQLPFDADLPTLRLWMQQEYQNIALAMQEPQDSVRLNTLYAAPERIYEGMIVLADGVVWKPNGTGGPGVYCYQGSTWTKLTN